MAVSGTKQAIMALSLDVNRGGKVGLVCRLRETEDDKESGRRRREAKSLAEVTDEENADLWLVEGKRKNTRSGSRRGGKWLQKQRLHQVPVAGCVGRGSGGGGDEGGGDAQFGNAITVDLPESVG